jgi:hypothetical protein
MQFFNKTDKGKKKKKKKRNKINFVHHSLKSSLVDVQGFKAATFNILAVMYPSVKNCTEIKSLKHFFGFFVPISFFFLLSVVFHSDSNSTTFPFLSIKQVLMFANKVYLRTILKFGIFFKKFHAPRCTGAPG